MKISKIDFEYLKMHPNLFYALNKCFESERFILYGVDNGIDLDLLARSKNNVFFIKNGRELEISNYLIDSNYEISCMALGNNEYRFSDGVLLSCRDGKMEESLTLVNDMNDEDPYMGQVIYTQYNPETDTECELRFDHRCLLPDGKYERIFVQRLSSFDYVSIDEQAKKKPFEKGFLGKKHKYFAGFSVDNDTYDYDILAIKEFGLLSYLHRGSVSLLNTDTIKRFTKGWYLTKEGNFKCMWPLGRSYTEEYVSELIERYHFSKTIPSDLIEVYNGDNKMYQYVSALLQEIKKIEEDKEKVGEMALLMSVHN